MSKSSVLREHVQRYIRATVAERLREQGFISKGNDDIYWYRVINSNVIHAVYFYTDYNNLPALLEIGYGCHPLFITPEFSTGPYLRYQPGNEVLYPRYVLMAPHNNMLYSEDIWVTCPEDESIIEGILTKIFEVLNTAVTPRNCYDMHKMWRKGEIENNTVIDVSTHFVDEVVFWDDRELYPFCERYIQRQEILLENALKKRPQSKQFLKEWDYVQMLRRSIVDGKRDEHMQILEQRAKRTIRLLEKHVGIRV